MLKPIDVNFDKMDAYILKKYGLVDIEKKDIFILLNILFMISGVISIVSFLYKSVNVIAAAGGVITVIISFVIFRMAKKYGKKIEKKEEIEK
jgi:membrane associated rhomboid family serine protease